MKKLFALIVFALTSQSQAQNLKSLPSLFLSLNEAFVGQEYINEKPTGHTCRIIILKSELTKYGSHCWKLNYQFDTYSGPKAVQAEVISSYTTDSDVFPRSCAAPIVDGSQVSAFDLNGALLYTPEFTGNKELGFFKGSEDSFLWFGRGNKRPVKAMLMKVTPATSNLYECIDLR